VLNVELLCATGPKWPNESTFEVRTQGATVNQSLNPEGSWRPSAPCS